MMSMFDLADLLRSQSAFVQQIENLGINLIYALTKG
jgi:hypothetical protein